MNSIAADIKVEGFVQGVGFRFFCYRLANNLNLTGWVRNNPEGSVGVYVEGDRSQIEELIDQLKVGPRAAEVTDVKVRWVPFSGKYKSFQVVG